MPRLNPLKLAQAPEATSGPRLEARDGTIRSTIQRAQQMVASGTRLSAIGPPWPKGAPCSLEMTKRAVILHVRLARPVHAQMGMAVVSRGAAPISRALLPARFASQCCSASPRILSPTWSPGRLFSASRHFAGKSSKGAPPPPRINPNTFKAPKLKPVPPMPKRKHKTLPRPPSRPTPDISNATLVSKDAAPVKGTVASRMAQAFARDLAAKGTETILYEAPSHTWYIMGSMFVSFFCVTYAAYNSFFHVFNPPSGLASWVPYSYGVIVTMMAGMGTYFFLQSGNIVAYIKAIPTTKLLLLKAKVSSPSPPPVLIEVGVRRPILGIGPKKMLLQPSEVRMPKKLCAPVMTLSRGQMVEIERQLKEKREAEIKYDKEHLLTAPFRQTGRAFRELFLGIKRVFSHEGFTTVVLGTRSYKIDILGGWALEDGRAADRLLMSGTKKGSDT